MGRRAFTCFYYARRPLYSASIVGISGDEAGEFLVEGRVGEESVEGDVHAVPPVMMRIGGDVDAFCGWVGMAQCTVDGEPVLKGQDAEK